MDLMTSKQMATLPPIEQAKKAIVHILTQIRSNPVLGYHMGFGSQAFSLLTEAYASLFEEPLEGIRKEVLEPRPQSEIEQKAVIAARQAYERYHEVAYDLGVASGPASFDELIEPAQKSWLMAANPHLREPFPLHA